MFSGKIKTDNISGGGIGTSFLVDILITDQQSFDSVFGSGTLDNTTDYDVVYIKSGNYTLNNNVIIEKDNLKIFSDSDAIIESSGLYNFTFQKSQTGETALENINFDINFNQSESVLVPLTDVPYVNSNDGDLVNPTDTINSELSIVPISSIDSGTAHVYLTFSGGSEAQWYTNTAVGGSPVWFGTGEGGSGIGSISFSGKPGFSLGTWNGFANISSGLKTFTFGNSDGFFNYYYDETAWNTAFSGESIFSSKVVIAQSGAVYKGSISLENLVIDENGILGLAGGGQVKLENLDRLVYFNNVTFTNCIFNISYIGITADYIIESSDNTNLTSSEIEVNELL